MSVEFESLMQRLDEYEKEFNELWEQYDPNDSYLKIELLGLKMDIIFYKAIIDCYQLLNEDSIDFYSNRIKKILTGVTFLAACASIPLSSKTAPGLTVASFMGTTYLAFKALKDRVNSVDLTLDEQNAIEQRIIDIEDDFVHKTDIVNDRTVDFESQLELDRLEEPERTQRILCTKLMSSIKNNKKYNINNNDNNEMLTNIIQNALGTNSNNLNELINIAQQEYDSLSSSVIKLYRKRKNERHIYEFFNS